MLPGSHDTAGSSDKDDDRMRQTVWLYLCVDGVKYVSISRSSWITASCHVSAHLPINRLFSTTAISSRHDGDLLHANKLWWWQCLTNRTLTGRYEHAWTSRKKGPGTSVHFAGGDSTWVMQTRRRLGCFLREETLVCTEHHGYKPTQCTLLTRVKTPEPFSQYKKPMTSVDLK